MRAVIGLLLCVTLACSRDMTYISRNPPGLQFVESPRLFVPCNICNTTNEYLEPYSTIEQKHCKNINGMRMRACPPNTSIYYNKICNREECYLERGAECLPPNLNFSYRGIECSPGVTCDEHSDGKHRCGSEPFRNIKVRRNDDTLKGLPLALRVARLYEELARRYGSSDDIQSL